MAIWPPTLHKKRAAATRTVGCLSPVQTEELEKYPFIPVQSREQVEHSFRPVQTEELGKYLFGPAQSKELEKYKLDKYIFGPEHNISQDQLRVRHQRKKETFFKFCRQLRQKKLFFLAKCWIIICEASSDSKGRNNHHVITLSTIVGVFFVRLLAKVMLPSRTRLFSNYETRLKFTVSSFSKLAAIVGSFMIILAGSSNA